MTKKVEKVTTSERPALYDIFSFGFGNGQRQSYYSRHDMHIFWLVTVTGKQERKYPKRKSLLQQAQSIKQIRISVFIITRRKENAMVKCRVCGGNCDNGELIGGVCYECLEEEQQRQIRADSVAKMIRSQSYQMELKLEEMKAFNGEN